MTRGIELSRSGQDAWQWPDITRTMRPWTRWWWFGNEVDKENITRLLTAYRDAGLGGVEITPIYGIQGHEDRDIPYLSERWLEMLNHTLAEATRLDLGVDMVTGTGWPFGGPWVSDEDAEDKLVIEKIAAAGGRPVEHPLGNLRPQAITAVSANGESVALLDSVTPTGTLIWAAPPGSWTIYIVTQKWAGREVKRAAPGGQGKCINPFSRDALMHYLQPFDTALTAIPRGAVRCHFHDSFEYLADWAPNVFEEFLARRGYDLRQHVAALAGDGDPDTVARVKTDYRETMSDMLLENFTQAWTAWTHTHGSISRNQAHGSPGNLLDLYGAADIPETEIFGGPGDPRAGKFASSAAHVLGKPLASSESCTWLREHFTVTLDDCKKALDRQMTAGINHLFYHGTPYSPDTAAWPGWLFYASTTFAPTDPLWHDFPALNAYLTRCQSVLQSSAPDNDLLLYWPLHDLWQHEPQTFMLEVNGAWLTGQPIGACAQELGRNGYSYDYLSDRQLVLAKATADGIALPGGTYQAIVVPPCEFMPEETLQRLAALAEAGARIIFAAEAPTDVPGYNDLPRRRSLLAEARAKIAPLAAEAHGNLPGELARQGIRREPLGAVEGVLVIRQRRPDGYDYFVSNQSGAPLNGPAALGVPFQSVVMMDPMTGRVGQAHVTETRDGMKGVWLTLAPGESRIIRTLTADVAAEPDWQDAPPSGGMTLHGPWTVAFVEGGPALPPPVEMNRLESWTIRGSAAEAFAGTACYRTVFDAPMGDASAAYWLDLGDVRESARVRLNGAEIGAVFAQPFRVRLDGLQPTGNTLEVDVTNVAANRIRDMDRRAAPWRIFREINFVNIRYRPFDASGWPVRESGLLGPVRLIRESHGSGK